MIDQKGKELRVDDRVYLDFPETHSFIECHVIRFTDSQVVVQDDDGETYTIDPTLIQKQ